MLGILTLLAAAAALFKRWENPPPAICWWVIGAWVASAWCGSALRNSVEMNGIRSGPTKAIAILATIAGIGTLAVSGYAFFGG